MMKSANDTTARTALVIGLMYRFVVGCIGVLMIALSGCPTPGTTRTAPEESRVDDAAVPPTRDVASASAPELADTAVDATPQVPGWYCFELRRRRGDDRYMSTCTKTLTGCEHFRGDAEGKGGRVSDCFRRATAYCFWSRNVVEQYQQRLCSDSEEQCMRQVEMARDSNQEYETHSKCREYE
jgi:hypothetical protein